ncbi:unnamed protein product [Caretta caretta]
MLLAGHRSRQILVNLWHNASKRFDFSSSSRNGHVYQLAALGIHRTGDQCMERIKWLMTNYWKARDENCTSGNSPSSCPFYEEFDQVLGTVLSHQHIIIAWSAGMVTFSPVKPLLDWRGAGKCQMRLPK